MSVDKKIKYEMQGDEKPARNYLGKQKTVTVPVKWKSDPKAPATELAYITKKEKDLLLKEDVHGSLKKGPNKGPSGVMSLDSQGDYTEDRSPGGTAPGVSSQNSDYMNQQIQAAHNKNMKDILTGQKNIGQTTRTGPRTRQYSNLPEFITMPGGKTKYIGSAYKSYGQPSFFGNLFSRGESGYRGIKGLPVFGTPTFETRKRPDGSLEYFTEDEDFGETRSAVPLGIFGILKNIVDSFKKPKDMSEFNKLSLTAPADQKVYIPEGMDPSMVINDPFAKPIGGGITTSNLNAIGPVPPEVLVPKQKPDVQYIEPLSPSLEDPVQDQVGDLSDLMAFNPGTVLDRKLKNAYSGFTELGIGKQDVIDLMKQDLKQNQEEGTPLSLPKEAYTLIG